MKTYVATLQDRQTRRVNGDEIHYGGDYVYVKQSDRIVAIFPAEKLYSLVELR